MKQTVELKLPPEGRARALVRRLGGCLVTAFVVMGAHFQAPALAQDKPQAVARSSIWDFGYVPQKSEVTHVFHIQNSGSAPLSIDKIKSGCACTSVSEIEDAIAPGDSAAIAVTFKSGRYHHGVKKATEVFTSDPDAPVIKLLITADVVKDKDETGSVSLEPRKLVIETDRDSTAAADTVIILNNSPDSLEVEVLHSPVGVVDSVELPESIHPGKSALAHVHVSKAPKVAEGVVPSTTLAFIGKDTTIVTIPIKIKD